MMRNLSIRSSTGSSVTGGEGLGVKNAPGSVAPLCNRSPRCVCLPVVDKKAAGTAPAVTNWPWVDGRSVMPTSESFR